MAHSLADWDLNVASPIIESRVWPLRTELILDDPGLQSECRYPVQVMQTQAEMGLGNGCLL